MQESDSNGESTFEWVERDKKNSDSVLTSDPASIPPPAPLPSFVQNPAGMAPPPQGFVPPPQGMAPLPQGMVPPPPTQGFSSQQSYAPPPPVSMLTPPSSSPLVVDMSGSDGLGMGSPILPPTVEQQDNRQEGWLGWFKGTVQSSSILNKVAEKAKSSVETVVTTLDPQMKDYLSSTLPITFSPGGSSDAMDITVASDKEVKISPIREAFSSVFGGINVRGLAAVGGSMAAQPVGAQVAVKAAEERINSLRAAGLVSATQPVVAIEAFIAELSPGMWFDMNCLVLDHASIGASIHVYSQAIPLPPEAITEMQGATPADYTLRPSGLALTTGAAMGRILQVPHTEWQSHWIGQSRRDILLPAAKTLAFLYRTRLHAVPR